MASRLERRSKRSANKEENVDSNEDIQDSLGEEILLSTNEPAAKRTKKTDESDENVDIEIPVSGNKRCYRLITRHFN